jgi:uncharacterized membrane protein
MYPLVVVLCIYIALEATYLYLFRTNYRLNFSNVQCGKDVLYQFFPFGILCYVVLLFALWYFVLHPSRSFHEVFMRSTVLALVVYGTYNLTNLATFYKFNMALAIQDMVWGIAVFNVIGALYFYMLNSSKRF